MENIIYEDDYLIVFYKPAGVPAQTKSLGQKDLVSMLKTYLVQKKEKPYIAVINRLDQPVEGLLLFAKTKEAATKLSRQSKERCMEKYYRAVVFNCQGSPLRAGESGTLTDYLLKDGRMNVSGAVKEGTPGAKESILHYTVLRTNGNLAEISIRLETGRHHQIRVQMAKAKLPLVGDYKYGCIEAADLNVSVKNIALCSVKIKFHHPKSGKKMEFETEPKNPAFQLLYA